MSKYVCENDPSHVFNENTVDGYCPICPYGNSKLQPGAEAGLGEEGGGLRNIGLAVLLMDVSGSMKAPAFPGHAATRAELVVRNAAEGILSLRDLSNKKDAYIMPVLFDHQVRPLWIKNVETIIADYADANLFASELHKSFTYGGTDINGALRFAKEVHDSLLQRNSLSHYGGPDQVRPLIHQVPRSDGSQTPVANIRVLMYTDGKDEVTGRITGNPFQAEATDILLGAYFGMGNEPGCTDLMAMLSACPTHNEKQFFLLNAPDRIQNLRFLFRMASASSGFCPKCLFTIVDAMT